MRVVIFILSLTCYPGGVLLGWGQQRNQSGVRIGTSSRGSSISSTTGRGGSGIKLGNANKGFTMRNISTTSTTTTTQTPEVHPAPPLESHNYQGRVNKIHVGLVMPQSSFAKRDYTKAVNSALTWLSRAKIQKLSRFKKHEIQVHLTMKSMTPSPTEESKHSETVMRTAVDTSI